MVSAEELQKIRDEEARTEGFIVKYHLRRKDNHALWMTHASADECRRYGRYDLESHYIERELSAVATVPAVA